MRTKINKIQFFILTMQMALFVLLLLVLGDPHEVSHYEFIVMMVLFGIIVLLFIPFFLLRDDMANLFLWKGVISLDGNVILRMSVNHAPIHLDVAKRVERELQEAGIAKKTDLQHVDKLSWWNRREYVYLDSGNGRRHIEMWIVDKSRRRAFESIKRHAAKYSKQHSS